MTTGNRIDLAAVEHFAENVGERALGVWFNPYAMAQTMLGLAEGLRESDSERLERLRQYDAITLEVSIILEKADDLSKKQIVQRLDDLYRGARGSA